MNEKVHADNPNISDTCVEPRLKTFTDVIIRYLFVKPIWRRPIIITQIQPTGAKMAPPDLLLCSGLQKTHLFCNIIECISSGQGRWFWYQSKAHLCDFLLVRQSAKNCLFSYPSLIRRPALSMFLWNFVVKLTVMKLESWPYLTVKTARS